MPMNWRSGCAVLRQPRRRAVGPGDDAAGAQIRVARQALRAAAAEARRGRRRHGRRPAPGHVGADRLDDAGALVAEHDRPVEREAPDAVDDVQIAVADAGRDGAHQHLAAPAACRYRPPRSSAARAPCEKRRLRSASGSSSAERRGFAESESASSRPGFRLSQARFRETQDALCCTDWSGRERASEHIRRSGVTSHRDTRAAFAQPRQPRRAARTCAPINMLVLHYTGMQSAEAAHRAAVRPGGKGQRALSRRGGRQGVAAGAGGAPRLACRRVVLAGRARAQLRLDRRSRSSIPATNGATARFPSRRWRRSRRCAATSSRATASRRTGSSAIPTSRPTARAIPASCSTGRGWRAPGSGCGPSRRPRSWRGGAGAASASSNAPPALADLARIGYCVSRGTEQVALAAFQRRFRPERWDGLLDGETSLRLRDVRLAVEAAQAAEAARLRNRFN